MSLSYQSSNSTFWWQCFCWLKTQHRIKCQDCFATARTWRKGRTGKVTVTEGLQIGKAIAHHCSPSCATEESQKIADPTSFLPLSSVGGPQIHARTYQLQVCVSLLLLKAIKLKMCFLLPWPLHELHINSQYVYFLQSFGGFRERFISFLAGLHQQAIMLAMEVAWF